MGFISRLLGREQNGALSTRGGVAVKPANKRQQPSSPSTGSFAPDCFGSRAIPATSVVKLQSMHQADAEADSDDEEATIRVPGSLSSAADHRSSSMSRRRAAIDISPAAVQRLADRVAILEAGHLRASLDADSGEGVTRTEVEALYTDMQLIHRGRSSLVYRAREVRSGARVILKAYDSSRLTPTKRGNLERQVRALKAALAVVGPQGGVVALERVVENPAGTYLVMQACNGGTLIEAMANSGGKLPERQVAIKVALPLLKALAALHACGIVHRDIKPEHLMIHNGSIKVGDFGNAGCMHSAPAGAGPTGSPSKQQQHSQPLTFLSADATSNEQQQQLKGIEGNPLAVTVTVAAGSGSGLSAAVGAGGVRDAMNFRTGSIEYMAPEMLDKPTSAEVFHLVIAQGIDEDDLASYDEKVDVWSLGVVLYEALTGLQPFLADNPADMAAVIGAKLATQQQQPEQQQQQPGHQAPQQQQHQFPPFIARLPVSADGKAFIAACLTWDAKQRPSAEQLLQHRWLAAMQEQAAAAAASRAASRRMSLSNYHGVAAVGAAAVTVAGGGVQSPVSPKPAGIQDWNAIREAVAAPARVAAVEVDPSVGLVDGLLAGALLAMPGGVLGLDQNAASLEQNPYSRSQTQINLEVGVRTVLRTNTQRLEPKASMCARVHAL